MSLKNRVAVENSIGFRIKTVHRERALVMIRTGEARYESAGIIRITQAVRDTDEMRRARINRIRVPHADSSTGDAGRGNTRVPRWEGMTRPSELVNETVPGMAHLGKITRGVILGQSLPN